MFGLNHLARLHAHERFPQILEGCLRSSVPLPLSIRLQLESAGSIAASATSCALGRSVELTHRMTAEIELFADDLLSRQREDGSFSCDESPATTVFALTALASFLDQAGRTHPTHAQIGRASCRERV